MKNRRDLLLASGATLLGGVSAPCAASAAPLSARSRSRRASSNHRGDPRALLKVLSPVPLGIPVLAFAERVRDHGKEDVAEFRFDWGDGTRGRCVDGLHGHVYERPGRYTVRVTIETPGEEPLEAVQRVLVTPAERPDDPSPALQAFAAAAELLPISARFRTALACLGEEAASDAAAAFAILQAGGDPNAAALGMQACHAALEAADKVLEAAIIRGELPTDLGLQFVSQSLVPAKLGVVDLLASLEGESHSGPHARGLIPEAYRPQCEMIVQNYGAFIIEVVLLAWGKGRLKPEEVIDRLGLTGSDKNLATFILACAEAVGEGESGLRVEYAVITFVERICT